MFSNNILIFLLLSFIYCEEINRENENLLRENLQLKKKINEMKRSNKELKRQLNLAIKKMKENNKINNVSQNESLLNNYSSYNELLEEVKKLRNRILNPLTKSEKYLKILYYLSPKKVIGKNLERIGGKYDGGYIMINDFKIEGPKIAYSVGIASDVSWDLKMVKRGYDIYMYDHTINKLPKLNQKFHWQKIGLCSKSNRGNNLKTLEELILENGHEKNKHMILKIDAEGIEEDVIIESEEGTLEKFDQIVLEYHQFRKITSETIYNKVMRAYEKINKTHQIFHIHPNNCCGFSFIEGIPIPNVIEVSYALRSKYKFANDLSFYPKLNLDNPNIKKRSEIILGFIGLLNIQ